MTRSVRIYRCIWDFSWVNASVDLLGLAMCISDMACLRILGRSS